MITLILIVMLLVISLAFMLINFILLVNVFMQSRGWNTNFPCIVRCIDDNGKQVIHYDDNDDLILNLSSEI